MELNGTDGITLLGWVEQNEHKTAMIQNMSRSQIWRLQSSFHADDAHVALVWLRHYSLGGSVAVSDWILERTSRWHNF